MTGQLTKDIGKSLTNSDDLANLKREISDLRGQLLRLNHIVSTGPEINRSSASSYPNVKFRNEESRKRILVTGGAGFVGSHLVDRLMLDGHEVIALDNFFTGRKRNVEQWIGHPNFELVHHDVVNPYHSEDFQHILRALQIQQLEFIQQTTFQQTTHNKQFTPNSCHNEDGGRRALADDRILDQEIRNLNLPRANETISISKPSPVKTFSVFTTC